MKSPRNGYTHEGYSKKFEELTFSQQARSISMRILVFRKALKAHLRQAKKEGRQVNEVARARLDLLRNVLKDFQSLETS